MSNVPPLDPGSVTVQAVFLSRQPVNQMRQTASRTKTVQLATIRKDSEWTVPEAAGGRRRAKQKKKQVDERKNMDEQSEQRIGGNGNKVGSKKEKRVRRDCLCKLYSMRGGCLLAPAWDTSVLPE